MSNSRPHSTTLAPGRSCAAWLLAIFALISPAMLLGQELVRTNSLSLGEAIIVPATGSNVVVATEGVIRAIPAGPGKLVVSAVKNGRTDMLVLDDDGKASQRYVFIVAEHTEAKHTYATSLEDFRKVIRELVGPTDVAFDVTVGPHISFDGTNIVSVPKPVLFIHGEAKDEIEARTIRNIASRFFGAGNFGATTVTQGSGGCPNSTNTVSDLNGDPNIVDQMTIGKFHQVRIRIQVAEVNVSAAKHKGIRYSDSVTWGIAGPSATLSELQQGNALNLLAQRTTMGLVTVSSGSGSGGGNGSIQPAVQAALQILMKEDSARLLSEPTLVAKSGEQAHFLAGGKLLQTQASTTVGAGASAGNFRTEEFGVRMTITPTVDRNDHIDMKLFTEVSEAPTIISDVNATITTRNSTTALRVNSGDTLILSGLLQNNWRNSIAKVPWLGQIPVLGALFRSKDWQSGQTELLFFVTPEIIGDLPSDIRKTVRTPVMKQWHYYDSHKDILPDPNSHAGPDNDMHDLLGLPADRAHDVEVPVPANPSAPRSAPSSSADATVAPADAHPLFPPPGQKQERKYK